jgi:hypothetical protein
MTLNRSVLEVRLTVSDIFGSALAWGLAPGIVGIVTGIARVTAKHNTADALPMRLVR